MAERKGYNTRALSLIEECLRDCGGRHLTVDDIVSAVESKGGRVGKTTVYRNLEKLMEKGTVRRYLGGESACFSWLEENCADHFHLKCNTCGRLIHLDCEHIKQLRSHIMANHNFAVDPTRTVLYGTCDRCAR